MLQPTFKRPPLVETIFGVQFDRLERFRNAHLGLFWKSLGEQWPNVVDAPPLPQEFERSDEASAWNLAGFMGLNLSQDTSPRLQVRTAAGDRMIQIQNGKLLYNWMGGAGGGEHYPRYSQVKAEFDIITSGFQKFVASGALGDWRPNQWEVAYLNHLPRGTVWQTPADWSEVLRLSPQIEPELGEVGLESVQGQWHYEIRPKRGRLHIGLAHGKEPGPDGQELLMLNFTARGPIPKGGNFNDGIRLGHEVIVHSFASLTSDAAREYWEQIV